MENHSKANKIIIYETDEGKVKIDVFFSDKNFWMTQKTMAELFDVKKPAISKHLKNIFESGELKESSTVSKMETVQNEGGGRVFKRLKQNYAAYG